MAKKYIEPELMVVQIVAKDVLIISSEDGENFGSAPSGWQMGGLNG